MNNQKPILIVGAGPVGLALANFLSSYGVSFHIIDSKSGTVDDSRAMGIHARTLEILQPSGLTNLLVKGGRKTRYMTFHEYDRELFSFDFNVLAQSTSYPYYLILPQNETEKILYEALKNKGIEVSWDTTLQSLEELEELEEVTVKLVGESRSKNYSYVIGCDGAGSLVRRLSKINFSGSTYNAQFLLAEVRISEDCLRTDSTHVIMTDDTTLAVIPLPNGAYRLVGPDTDSNANVSGEEISFDVFSKFLKRNHLLQDMTLYSPERLISYKIQKRVADKFMTQRVFLAGDAAHVHSPAGGQGMNTGIQDVANLAWKIALVLQNDVNPKLLNTYNSERRPIAKLTVNGTDKAMKYVGSRNILTRLVTRYLAPLWFYIFQPKKLIFAMSELSISYGELTNYLGAGDRLPLVKVSSGWDLFDLFGKGVFVMIHLEKPKPLHTVVEVNHINIVDNRYFRLKEHEENTSIVSVPMELSELEKLGKVSRILVRPDGYILAIDKFSNDTSCQDELEQFLL